MRRTIVIGAIVGIVGLGWIFSAANSEADDAARMVERALREICIADTWDFGAYQRYTSSAALSDPAVLKQQRELIDSAGKAIGALKEITLTKWFVRSEGSGRECELTFDVSFEHQSGGVVVTAIKEDGQWMMSQVQFK